MKILSINSEYTKSEHQIALNLDEELTTEFVELLDFGDFKLVSNGTILHVSKDEGETPFDQVFIANLQAKLDALKRRQDESIRLHRRMQEMIARSTDLPLD